MSNVSAINVGRIVLLSSSALVSLAGLGAGMARAQEAAPEVRIEQPIVVTTPSPIRRRPAARPAAPAARPARAPTPSAPATPPPPAEPVVAAPQPGTLPIVTDQFATVTVVTNEELRRTPGGTLGDVLFQKPGITGSSFAPGASSRPIVRGLDVNRVGIAENGIGANGASDLGEDHFVPVNPLTINQLEVIRGPATLRYGSQSIGGIVNGTNNRIPEALPCVQNEPLRAYAADLPVKAPPPAATSARPCVSFETRGSLETVNSGREGAVLLDAGGGNFAIHADAFDRQTENYRVPRYPYLTPPNPLELPFATQPNQFNGRQPNSAMRADGQAVGGSYVFNEGFLGIAYARDNTLYHIPGIDAEGHLTRIDAHQDKVTSKGEWRPQAYAIDTVRFWAGATNYKHNEIGLADPFDIFSDGIRQTFTNKEQEARAEITLMPMNLQFATLTTAVGVQGGHQRLTAPGDTTDPGNGLFDPNKNHRIAGFIFNEFKFSDWTKGQIAGRVESVDLSGTARIFPGDGALLQTPVSRNYTPKSASVGLIQNLPWDLVASVTAQYVERAPKPAEMFSGGPHDATATFDIGNPNLKIEVAKSFEAGLRRNTGPFRFELTGFYTRFDGFIFRALTGETCDETIDTCTGPLGAPGATGGELQQALYSQRNATFRGVEFQSQWDVMPLWMGTFGLESQFDVVRATFTDGTNVPRIPPVRVGGGVFWRDANWLARVNLLHAFSHTEIAPIGETPTPGYNNLRAEISYRWKPARLTADNLSEFVVGIVGNNLLNDDIRNSVTYTPQKDEVLMPGASVKVFANIKY
jgi:iron complex outermembrane receptor protein